MPPFPAQATEGKRPYLRLEPAAGGPPGGARPGAPLSVPPGQLPAEDDSQPATAPLSHASFATMLGAASARRSTAAAAKSIGVRACVVMGILENLLLCCVYFCDLLEREV